MKLYVIPIGWACQAHCKYCITKYRNTKNDILDLKTLKKVLEKNNYEKIEITGGGEPTLHPKINEIIKICANNAPTIMYTNGVMKPSKKYMLLKQLCISRAHYNNKKNKEIMKVKYNINDFYEFGIPIKLSLMIHKSGIHTSCELRKYLEWANNYAKKVVIRQLFEYDDDNYKDFYNKEFMSSEDLAYKLFPDTKNNNKEENIFCKYKNLEIEFERRTCACENNNPVLYADGVLRNGWI